MDESDDQKPAPPMPTNAGPAAPRRPVRAAQKRGVRRPVQATRESRFVGYIVLGFGILAVLAVLLLAFGNKRGAEAPEIQENIALAPQPAAPAPASSAPQRAAPVPLPPPPAEIRIDRQPSVRESQMQGGWHAIVGDYRAVIQVQKNAYQIVLAHVDPSMPRKYTSGQFRMIDDIMMLEPRLDWKAPASPGGAPVVYERLTMSPFPMMVGFSGNRMVWQNPPQSEQRIYVPASSPLLLGYPQKQVVWQKLR